VRRESQQEGSALRFGELLRRHRLAAGLTQQELAERAAVSVRGISALEQGERQHPYSHTVRQLAEALGLEREERAAFERAARRAEQPHPGLSERSDTRLSRSMPVGSFLGARPESVMVAREGELARIRRLMAEVAAGAGRVLLVAGEPGIGKTRLAQEVSLELADTGFSVAMGRCYEPQQTIPFYPFRQALGVLLQQAPPQLRSEIPRRFPYVTHLLAESVSALPAVGNDPQLEQQRLYRSVSGLFLALAQEEPVALLLDDLHWADAASLELLLHLARETRGHRVMILGTYRETERSEAVERLRVGLGRDGLAEPMVLGRLDVEGTGALVAAALKQGVSGDLAAFLHRHAEGNPFFTHEVLRTLLERGQVYWEEGVWARRPLEELGVPETVRLAIRQRVGGLSDGTQKILREASVLGQRFRFQVLQGMGARSEQEVEEALEEAAEVGLVQEIDAEASSFDHVLTQQALYGEISLRKRQRLHRAAGAAMEVLGEEGYQGAAAEVAWHFLEGKDRDRALHWSLQAGDEAARVFAHAEAERQYRTALELARDNHDRAREAEALLKLGPVLRLAGQYDDALELLEWAAEMCRSAGDLEGEARAIQTIGNVHHARGTPQAGYGRVRAVVERLERLPETSRPQLALAELYVVMGLDLFPTGRYTEVVVASERAAKLVGAANDVRSRAASGLAKAHALTMMGRALTMMGRWAEARRVLEETLPTFEAMGNPWRLAHPIGNIARTYVHQGDLARGRRYWERALELDEAANDPSEVAWASCYLGDVSFIAGEWIDAHQQFERAAGLARSAGSARYLSHALLHLADLCATQGREEEAWRYVEEAIPVAERVGDVPAARTAQRLLAERDLAEGHPEAALTRLEPLVDWLSGEEPHAFPPPILAEAYLLAGDIDRAHELVEQRVEQFIEQEHQRALALWLRVQGMVRTRQHRWQEAERIFVEAASLAHDMPYPYAEGRILREDGLLRLRGGETERARERLTQAQAIFRRLGARQDVEQTEQTLARLGPG
jgi:tetratricopeptide (TPR) repeat protein/transcriptional regulator with XRE-family HTH domain